MKKRKIAVTTGTRAEYGLLRQVLDEIQISKILELEKLLDDYNNRQNDRGESLATESRKRVIRGDAQLSFDFATNQAKHTAESLESIHNFSKDENVGIPEAIHSGIQAQKVAKYIGNFSTQLDY